MIKENIGIVYTICQGAILTFFAHLGIVAFLMMTLFELTLPWLTTILVSTVFFVCMFIGYKSNGLWMVTGPIVGLITIGMILAYLSQYKDMDWELNALLAAIYVGISFFGAFAGHWFRRKKAV